MKKTVLRRGAQALALAAALLAGPTACVNDLDREPFYEVNTDTIYRDPANYVQVLAKLYAGLNLAGQTSVGSADLSHNGDEGEASYFRAYWALQQLPTDETIVAWNNAPIQDLNTMRWNSANNYVRFGYNRIFYEISICNEFIRETSDDKLNSRNIMGQDAANARQYRAEARFLRALAYYHALDLFGRVPFVTESDLPSSQLRPKQISRADLFAYLEKELKALAPALAPPHRPGYGHADRAAAWTLLAKLYLNARVYTGQERYTSCVAYCDSVLQPSAGYALVDDYSKLFLADNDQTSASEIIFPITNDGLAQQTYGGTTYLVHAAVGGRMLDTSFGIKIGWFGNRSRKNLPLLFPEDETDGRAMFFVIGQTLEIPRAVDVIDFTKGYGVTKFRNKTYVGNRNGKDDKGNFVDIDFPLFRLADVLLMYGEAVVRGGAGGNPATALAYVNALRQRAYGTPDGNVDLATMTRLTNGQPDFFLDERGRELYWEGQRRTDLIRFGKFTDGRYLWPWKGGSPDGQGVSDNLNVYPIPATDLVANPSLTQNAGY